MLLVALPGLCVSSNSEELFASRLDFEINGLFIIVIGCLYLGYILHVQNNFLQQQKTEKKTCRLWTFMVAAMQICSFIAASDKCIYAIW